MKSNSHADLPLRLRAPGCEVPMTSVQKLAWHLGSRTEGARIGQAVCIRGDLDIGLLQSCIEQVVQRHESLRTQIELVDTRLMLRVQPPDSVALNVVDARTVFSAGRGLVREFLDEKVNLLDGPLFSIELLQTCEREYVLVWGIDHIVSDATSLAIIGKDIWTLYEQGARAMRFSLPKLPLQFADYAVWEHEKLDACKEKYVAYWRRRMSNVRPFELPFERGTSGLSFSWVDYRLPNLGSSLSGKLEEMAWRERVPLPLLLLAICIAVVARWYNHRDIVVSFVSHGRQAHPQLANATGLFATMLLLRIEIDEAYSLTDFLRRVELEFHAANEHADTWLAHNEMAGCEVALGFNWLLTKKIQLPLEVDGACGITLQQLDAQPVLRNTTREQRMLMITVQADATGSGEGIALYARHQSHLFPRSELERFHKNLQEFAEAFVERSSSPISSLSYT